MGDAFRQNIDAAKMWCLVQRGDFRITRLEEL